MPKDTTANLLDQEAALVGRAVEHAAVLLGPAQQVGDGLPYPAVRDVLVRLRKEAKSVSPTGQGGGGSESDVQGQ